MPQILRRPIDSITVTVHASSARFPTAVVLPKLGSRINDAGKVLVSSTTNVGRFAWDVDEGADATVAASFPMGAAGTVVPIPLPPMPRTAAQALLKRHVVTLKINTALADGEKFTVDDGEAHTLTLEADAASNGVAGGSTEIGTNASTAATQATGVAAALLTWGSGLYVRGEVDAEDTAGVVMMGHTAAKAITITHSGTVTSETTVGDVTTTVIDLGTGIITVTDYGSERPILYVLSATTSTAISIATVGNA